MKKIDIVLLALVAVLAFSAVLAGSASATITTLLANWLVEGGTIPEGTKDAATMTGGLLLEDTKTLAGAAAVLCEGVADGFVGFNGEDEIIEILNLADEKIGELGGLGVLCVSEQTCAAATEASPVEVWPVGLPWLVLLFLEEEAALSELFLILVSSVSAKDIGYELLCLILGLNVEDACSAEDQEVEVVNDSDTLDAAIPALATLTPNMTCTQSKEPTGIIEVDALIPVLLASGLLLTVSE